MQPRVLGALLPLCLCLSWGLAGPAAAQVSPRNVLLIIADDLGVDRVAAYGVHPDPGHTPVLDGLAAEGLLFRNAWSNPNCPPTRAGILTGRHGYRTGFASTNFYTTPTELPLAELTIAEALPPEYHSAVVGKWHMASLKGSGYQHPMLQGFESFRGSMTIFGAPTGDSYFSFVKVIDGASLLPVNRYATTDQVDDALELIQGWGGEPWFLWLAFHAPHGPFHKPPDDLHSFGPLPDPIGAHIPLHVKAAIEAMDTEIGRLLAGIPPDVRANTVVIALGDNGTDKVATTAPFQPTQAKGTVYQGGVNVPFIVQGPGVLPGSECPALINTTDVFATVLELAGVTGVTAEDSVSLVPYFGDPDQPSLRDTVYTEAFTPNGNGPYTSRSRAVRDSQYKLVRISSTSGAAAKEQLFDLLADPYEQVDLLASPPLLAQAQAAFDGLAALLAEPAPSWHAMSYTGLAGSSGASQLSGTGALQPSEPLVLSLTNAPPAAPSALIVGTSNLRLAFKGGVFATAPIVTVPLRTTSSGDCTVNSAWPPDLPPGACTFFQIWSADPAAPTGWTGSNGLAAFAE